MRASISAELDGALSDFESILLRGHLLRCGSCRVFKRDSGSIAHALRTAPLEPMSRPLIVSRRRPFAFRALQLPGAAALAVLMVASGGLFASLHSSSVLREPSGVHVGVLDDPNVQQLQRMKPVAALAALRVRREALGAQKIPRTTGFQNP